MPLQDGVSHRLAERPRMVRSLNVPPVGPVVGSQYPYPGLHPRGGRGRSARRPGGRWCVAGRPAAREGQDGEAPEDAEAREVAEASQTAEAAEASSERVSSWSSRTGPRVEAAVCIESTGSVRIKGLLLLSVRENFVCGLCGSEFLLRTGVFVCVGVVLFRHTIVGLFYVGSGCISTDAECLVRVGHGEGRGRGVEELCIAY